MASAFKSKWPEFGQFEQVKNYQDIVTSNLSKSHVTRDSSCHATLASSVQHAIKYNNNFTLDLLLKRVLQPEIAKNY